MKEVSKVYVDNIEGFADISVEISTNGNVRLTSLPTYTVSAEVFTKALRTLADNIDKIIKKEV